MKSPAYVVLWLVLVSNVVCAEDGLTTVEAKAQAEKSTDAAELERQISKLVSALNSARASERDEAERGLLDLAGTTTAETDRFLSLLPKDHDEMPLAVRERMSRIRQQIEDRVAKGATEVTKVTLSAKGMPLADVFKSIEKQTGNKIVDSRQADDGDAKGPSITIELKDEPFWSAVDQILDQAKLSVYSFGGEEALSIVARAADAGSRSGAAVYAGPFRLEALETQAQRSRRQSGEKSLKLQLEIAWEPRLRPIALLQSVVDMTATTDDGNPLAVNQSEASLDVEVPSGTQAAEVIIPFELPSRDVKKIATLRAKLHALVPGRHAKFEFKDVGKAIGQSQRTGGVHVTLDEVRKNGAVWEIHARVTLDDANNSLRSHRNWVFQNLSYLVNKDGERIENAGFETTRQTENEAGVAYIFDVTDVLEGLTWVYESPAAIVDLPVEYELKDIELP